MKKESTLQKAERIARKRTHSYEEQSFLIDTLVYLEMYDNDTERTQKLVKRINHLVDEWNKEYEDTTSVPMKDIQFDLGEGLLKDIEISANPLRMPDLVLDGYNEETGEFSC